MNYTSPEEFNKIWNKPVIRVGMTTVLLAALFSFAPVVWLCISQRVLPPIGQILQSWALVAASFGALYIVEPISYYSVLGLSGTYLSFLSGNIGNMRVPCAAMALEATNTTPGTQQAEVVSTLGITGSILVNIFFTTLAAFIGAALINVLPPVIADAFKNYSAPAIFGAAFGQFAVKYPKIAVFSFGRSGTVKAVLQSTGICFDCCCRIWKHYSRSFLLSAGEKSRSKINCNQDWKRGIHYDRELSANSGLYR